MKPLRIILLHFRFLLALNLLWSIALLSSVFTYGLQTATAISLIIVAKVIGYGVSILIERWLYAGQREYYFKNMSLSYVRLFGCLFLLDTVLLIFIALLWLIIKNCI